MRRSSLVLALGVAAVAAGVASAKAPWPGLAGSVTDPRHQVRYIAGRGNYSTTVYAVRNGRVQASVRVPGAWGIPAVTSTGVAGGLSSDGRTLVLAEPPDYQGLRAQSRFLVVSTTPFAVRTTIVLNGEFGFDALSPNARTLYLIQHVSAEDLVAYRVRGYDLLQKRLLPGTIVAKGESETMRGYPVARATSTSGRWVYTLYHRSAGRPFVHALNAAQRYAVCIDLPGQGSANNLRLSPDGRRLTVRLNGSIVATIDTRNFRVT